MLYFKIFHYLIILLFNMQHILNSKTCCNFKSWCITLNYHLIKKLKIYSNQYLRRKATNTDKRLYTVYFLLKYTTCGNTGCHYDIMYVIILMPPTTLSLEWQQWWKSHYEELLPVSCSVLFFEFQRTEMAGNEELTTRHKY